MKKINLKQPVTVMSLERDMITDKPIEKEQKVSIEEEEDGTIWVVMEHSDEILSMSYENFESLMALSGKAWQQWTELNKPKGNGVYHVT